MHRILVVQTRSDHPDRFVVIADSADESITQRNAASLEAVGGTPWEERHDTPGYNAPASTIEAEGAIDGLSYWYVNQTDEVLVYDFAATGVSERKVVTSGELQVEYEGRRFVAETGDSMIYLTDPYDVDDKGRLRPFVVSFLAEQSCTVVYTDFKVC